MGCDSRSKYHIPNITATPSFCTATAFVANLINEMADIYVRDIAQERVYEVLIKNTMFLYNADTSGDGDVTESVR